MNKVRSTLAYIRSGWERLRALVAEADKKEMK